MIFSMAKTRCQKESPGRRLLYFSLSGDNCSQSHNLLDRTIGPLAQIVVAVAVVSCFVLGDQSESLLRRKTAILFATQTAPGRGITSGFCPGGVLPGPFRWNTCQTSFSVCPVGVSKWCSSHFF